MGDSGDAPGATLERYANLLQSGTKREKESAIRDLKRVVDAADGELLDDVRAKLQNQLIICLEDRHESVREGALAVGRSLIERLPAEGAHVAPLMPALFARVCRREDREPSEEILWQIADLANLLVDNYGKRLAPYAVEIVEMVVRLSAEPSPQVKTAAAALAANLASALPRETFQNTGKLWPPLVSNLTHQRWRVRVSAVEALERLMLTGDNKFVGEVTPALNKKMLDPVHQVRLAIVKLAGRWLVQLPDRYSFFAHLVPILLSGIADGHADVAAAATSLWAEAGDNYLRENDADLKDRINFEGDLDDYPPNLARPSLGCRILVEREASKFLLALANELTDWVELVRVKSSILLTQLILHMERSVTMSVGKLMPQVCRAARDENRQVSWNARLAAEYVGRFVPADVYCRLVVDRIADPDDGELLVVAALVRGTRRAELAENLGSIAALMEPPAAGKRQAALLELIAAVVRVAGSDALEIGEDVWAALVGVVGLADGELVREEAARALDEFVALGGGDRREISSRYCGKLLGKLDGAVWTANCREQHVLAAVVDVAAEIVTDRLDAICRIFRNASGPDVDAEVLLKVFMTTNALLSKADVALTTDVALARFVGEALSYLPVHLRWSAGRKAEALRTAACTCLFMCLSKMAPLRHNRNSNGKNLPAKIQKSKPNIGKVETCEKNRNSLEIIRSLSEESQKSSLTAEISAKPQNTVERKAEENRNSPEKTRNPSEKISDSASAADISGKTRNSPETGQKSSQTAETSENTPSATVKSPNSSSTDETPGKTENSTSKVYNSSEKIHDLSGKIHDLPSIAEASEKIQNSSEKIHNSHEKNCSSPEEFHDLSFIADISEKTKNSTEKIQISSENIYGSPEKIRIGEAQNPSEKTQNAPEETRILAEKAQTASTTPAKTLDSSGKSRHFTEEARNSAEIVQNPPTPAEPLDETRNFAVKYQNVTKDSQNLVEKARSSSPTAGTSEKAQNLSCKTQNSPEESRNSSVKIRRSSTTAEMLENDQDLAEKTCSFAGKSQKTAETLEKTRNSAEDTQNSPEKSQNPSQTDEISPPTSPILSKSIQITDVSSSTDISEPSRGNSSFELPDLGRLLESLLPLLMSLVQDPSPKTRLLALKSVEILSSDGFAHDAANSSTIVGQLLKRLDDADGAVRRAAVDAVAAYYERHLSLTPSESVNRSLAGFAFSTLLIHLDDKDAVLKRSVLNCLKIVSGIDPRAMRAKVSPDNFIDKGVCRELMDFLEELIKSDGIS